MTSLIVGEGSCVVEKNTKAGGPKNEIGSLSHITQTDQTFFSENRPTTKIILMAKSLNESSSVRRSIDVRTAPSVEKNVPDRTAADSSTSKELNGEKTNDLLFLGFEKIRETIEDKKKREQDMSSSKNMLAIFLRRSHDIAQEKCAGSTEAGTTSGPKSITANAEILLSPTKDEISCKVSFDNIYIAHDTLPKLFDVAKNSNF